MCISEQTSAVKNLGQNSEKEKNYDENNFERRYLEFLQVSKTVATSLSKNVDNF